MSLSRSLRRFNWHSLQEFASRDADAVAFRGARALAADVSATVSAAKQAKQSPSEIDWAQFQSSVRHQDLVSLLKQHHDSQIAALDALLKDSTKTPASVSSARESTLSTMKSDAEKAVLASETIVANGAKALYIASNNPSVSEVGTSEWLDTDQYWAAFVEKHQFYHNHLDPNEDPESEEYKQKLKTDLIRNLKLMDEAHPRKGLLYQKPSHDFYTFYKSVLVEHMVYYLVKVGGDCRTFPEVPDFQTFEKVYEAKFKILEVLQRRRRIFQEETLERELQCEYMPKDLVHGGEAYYSKLISEQNQLIENQVSRLMGNYMFLSDAVPVQTTGAFLEVSQQIAASSEEGDWYSLGDDVNALFWKPTSGTFCVSSSSPEQAFTAYCDHLSLTGKKLHPVLTVCGEIFSSLLQERKTALSGSWFNIAGEESSADAFMRRLKFDDPRKPVFEEYCEELKTRWSESATKLTPAEALAKLEGGVESAYLDEVHLYEKEVLYNAGDNAESKAALEKLAKMAEGGELGGKMEKGEIMAIGEEGAEELMKKVGSA